MEEGWVVVVVVVVVVVGRGWGGGGGGRRGEWVGGGGVGGHLGEEDGLLLGQGRRHVAGGVRVVGHAGVHRLRGASERESR